ncbi:hypothetical protein QT423_22385, partial [Xanthomonas citri pv. citri]
LWRFPFSHCSYLGGVNCNALLGYDVSKKSNFTEPEFTLIELSVQLVLSKFLHNQTKMLFMFLVVLGIDQYVVSADYDKLIQKFHEHLVHHVHKI